MKTPICDKDLINQNERLLDLIYAVHGEADIRNVRGIIDRELKLIYRDKPKEPDGGVKQFDWRSSPYMQPPIPAPGNQPAGETQGLADGSVSSKVEPPERWQEWASPDDWRHIYDSIELIKLRCYDRAKRGEPKWIPRT